MMNYRQMVDAARAAGVTTEKTMWESIDSFSELLEQIKEAHPQLYWDFMRKQQGIMHHNHYDELIKSFEKNAELDAYEALTLASLED